MGPRAALLDPARHNTWRQVTFERGTGLFTSNNSVSQTIPVLSSTRSAFTKDKQKEVLASLSAVTGDSPADYIFHGTNSVGALSILRDGIKLDMSVKESDFGCGFYAASAMAVAISWGKWQS